MTLSGANTGGLIVGVLRLLVVVGIHLNVQASDEIAETADESEIERYPGLVIQIEGKDDSFSTMSPDFRIRLQTQESLHPLIPPESQTSHWSGTISIRKPGTYRFGASVVGAFKLFVDGRQVISITTDKESEPLTKFGEPIRLNAGYYSIRATFKRIAQRPAYLNVHWILPDGFQEPIPSALLSHTADQLPENGADQARLLETGFRLLAEAQCLKCHTADSEMVDHRLIQSKAIPSFEKLSAGNHRGWLRLFLSNPKHVKSHSKMPQLFRQEATDQADLEFIIEFLESLSVHQSFSTELAADGSSTSGPNRDHVPPGKTAFGETGCIACHLLPSESPTENNRLISLNHVPKKYELNQLIQYLTDSAENGDQFLRHNPRLDSSDRDSDRKVQIARFLMTESEATDNDPASSPSAPVSDAAVENRFLEIVTDEQARADFLSKDTDSRRILLGQQIALKKGCFRCHQSPQIPKSTSTGFLPFERLIESVASQKAHQGCLAQRPPKDAPDYGFSDFERQAITFVMQQILRKGTLHQSPVYEQEAILRCLQCTNCHDRGRGASEFEQRAQQFVNLKRDMLLRDILPPSLIGVERRLHPKHLTLVLTNHIRIRPWLDLRMPKYDRDAVSPLLESWSYQDDVGRGDHDVVSQTPTADQLEAGRLLVGRTGFNCVGCHDFDTYRATGVHGPDLATVTNRIRSSWFRQWLHDPQTLSPGTRMPSYFRDGVSILPDVLNGREEDQALAIWHYLSHQEGRIPPLLPVSGMGQMAGREVAKPIPIDRPILRFGFLPDHAGHRAVVVGNPSGLHFAWDSSLCQLKRVWMGPFIDQAGWEGSGKGDVAANAMAILGDVIWRNDHGSDILISRSADGSQVDSTSTDFQECGTDNSHSWFAWNILSDDGTIMSRVEETLQPLSLTNLDGFRRSISFAGLSADLTISQRLFCGTGKERLRLITNSEDTHSVRIGGETHDWVIFVRGQEKLSIQGMNQTSDGNFESANDQPTDVFVRFASKENGHPVKLDVYSFRLLAGTSLSAEALNLLRSEANQP